MSPQRTTGGCFCQASLQLKGAAGGGNTWTVLRTSSEHRFIFTYSYVDLDSLTISWLPRELSRTDRWMFPQMWRAHIQFQAPSGTMGTLFRHIFVACTFFFFFFVQVSRFPPCFNLELWTNFGAPAEQNFCSLFLFCVLTLRGVIKYHGGERMTFRPTYIGVKSPCNDQLAPNHFVRDEYNHTVQKVLLSRQQWKQMCLLLESVRTRLSEGLFYTTS